MALSPLKPASQRATRITTVPQPSKTYAIFDMKTVTETAWSVTPVVYSYQTDDWEIGDIIDGKAAIRQFIRKAIATARFRFPIYNAQYGCELDDLIGQDVPLPLLQAEIPRVIREALIYDDRIRDVNNFAIERTADVLYVSFTVLTTEGTINEAVTI